MLCKLCDRNTRCACRWWWCPDCNQNNRQVEYTNSIIDFGAELDGVRKNLSLIHLLQEHGMDSFTVYEYVMGKVDKKTEKEIKKIEKKSKETLGHTVAKNEISDDKSVKGINIPEIENFVKKDNPNKECVFPKAWPWERCLYCNGVAKYMKDKTCPSYKEE